MDIDEIRNTFSARIRKLREETGLNQGEFADKVGVSRGAMSYYEQKARTPDIGVLRSICEKCGVSADYMIGLIPDQDRTVSDVCLETGLFPIAARRLRLLQMLKKLELESSVTIIEEFDDAEDAEDALKLTPFTAAQGMVNLLLATDEGLDMLNLLGAIIFGAELCTGSDEPPVLRFMRAHKNIEITYPLGNITASLWVNVQEDAAALRDKINAANPELPKEYREFS